MVDCLRRPKRSSRHSPFFVAKLVAKTILNCFCLEFRLEPRARLGGSNQARRLQNKKHPDWSAFVLEVTIGFEPMDNGVADRGLTTWLRHRNIYGHEVYSCPFSWSGLRGSNPPPRPWQGRALPNELNPHIWCLRSESNQRHEDFQSSALPTELQRHTAKAVFNLGDPDGTRTHDL